MHGKYLDSKIHKIWSNKETEKLMFHVWDRAVQWRDNHGFKLARLQATKKLPIGTHHEVIDALHHFINKTGLINAHAGMTSSDVIDNVRLIQVERSLGVIKKLVHDDMWQILWPTLHDKNYRLHCVGYTHWQIATQTTMDSRFTYWYRVFNNLATPPEVHQKKIGGGTGTGEALQILVDSKEEMVLLDLMPPRGASIQSTDHLDELAAAQWLETLMAHTHKICQDIRFLCHTGEISIVKDPKYKGSSAMPTKQNPIEAEQICSLARLQPSYTRAIWDAMAFNGMERTMDNSAILRTTLPDMFNNAAYCLDKLAELIKKVRLNPKRITGIYRKNVKAATVEIRMANLIKHGTDWHTAHEQLKERS